MHIRHFRSDDKDHSLVSAVFTRQSADAGAPTLEVVYRLHTPDDFYVKGDVCVLSLVSVTRTDTREAIAMEDEEHETVLQQVTNWVSARYENGNDSLSL